MQEQHKVNGTQKGIESQYSLFKNQNVPESFLSLIFSIGIIIRERADKFSIPVDNGQQPEKNT